jgi:hypothetical protein
LRESSYSTSPQFRIDEEAGIAYNVKIQGFDSENGDPDGNPYITRRHYPKEVLRQAIPLYEGVPVNIDHYADGKWRTFASNFGKITDVYLAADGLRGNMHFNREHEYTKQFLEAARRGFRVGLSPDVLAATAVDGNCLVVTRISEVKSVDLVANPATTTSLQEGAEVKKKSKLNPKNKGLKESTKLERCVKDVKKKGNIDSAWGVCRASLNECGNMKETGMKECECVSASACNSHSLKKHLARKLKEAKTMKIDKKQTINLLKSLKEADDYGMMPDVPPEDIAGDMEGGEGELEQHIGNVVAAILKDDSLDKKAKLKKIGKALDLLEEEEVDPMLEQGEDMEDMDKKDKEKGKDELEESGSDELRGRNQAGQIRAIWAKDPHGDYHPANESKNMDKNLQAGIVALREQVQKQEKEIQSLKEQKAKADRRFLAVKLCDEARIPEDFRTDVFMTQLYEARDEKHLKQLVQWGRAMSASSAPRGMGVHSLHESKEMEFKDAEEFANFIKAS